MEEIKLAYKQDRFGNDLLARVIWRADSSTTIPRPVVVIYHAGGLMAGSANLIPKPQIEYLCSHDRGFVVVIPNYRLMPQVTGKQILEDSIDAFDWIKSDFRETLRSKYGVKISSDEIVAMGHSSGGTLALNLVTARPVRAVTVFYPTLYISDTSSSSHKPLTGTPFGPVTDFEPSEEDWKQISPDGFEVSEAGVSVPGTDLPARNKLQMSLLKNGKWISTLCADGDFAALDPLTRVHKDWPSILIVQGEKDDVPGSGLDLAEKAIADIQQAGVREVQIVKVPDAVHMFDVFPMIGTTDLGPHWQAVLKGLDHLIAHA